MKKILRITQYLDKEKISLSAFERDAKLGYSYLGKTRDRGQEITQKMLDKIRDNQPDHFYKIFPEEKRKESEENFELNEAEKPYNNKADEFMKMLQRTLNVIESQQRTIESQQGTIHELATGGAKPNIASA